MGSKVKICGLVRPEDIETANLCRPDYIGFVFAMSDRVISLFLSFFGTVFFRIPNKASYI